MLGMKLLVTKTKIATGTLRDLGVKSGHVTRIDGMAVLGYCSVGDLYTTGKELAQRLEIHCLAFFPVFFIMTARKEKDSRFGSLKSLSLCHGVDISE